MTSYDYFVGFEREPIDLDAFLKNQGYNLDVDTQDNSTRNYTSRDGLVDLFYFPEVVPVDEGEAPDWSKSRCNVTSDLMISIREFNAIDEAQKIAKETVRKYDGVFYDYDLDDFF